MTDWLMMAPLLAAIAVLAAVVWWALRTVADMRTSVQETVEEALGKAAMGFENASYKALDEQQAKASATLDKSLAPVQKELEEARKKLEEHSRQALADATDSRAKHDEVMRSINNLDKEAGILSKALRGENVKMMGDWGEHALEKILETAGLEEGISYERQANVETDEGKRRPDILIKLPKDGGEREKVLAVDSKVALAGYTEYAAAGDNEEGRKAGLDKLVAAVKKQAEQTAKYKKIEGCDTPGFALMFMPVTPAWELLQRHQNGQFVADIQRRQDVVILGPANLLVSLRMVADLWRGHKRAANVEEFAVTAGRLLDSFDLTLERLANLKKAIAASQEAIEKMETSLQGQQGLEKYAKKLRELGAKGKKVDDAG